MWEISQQEKVESAKNEHFKEIDGDGMIHKILFNEFNIKVSVFSGMIVKVFFSLVMKNLWNLSFLDPST